MHSQLNPSVELDLITHLFIVPFPPISSLSFIPLFSKQFQPALYFRNTKSLKKKTTMCTECQSLQTITVVSCTISDRAYKYVSSVLTQKCNRSSLSTDHNCMGCLCQCECLSALMCPVNSKFKLQEGGLHLGPHMPGSPPQGHKGQSDCNLPSSLKTSCPRMPKLRIEIDKCL